MTKLSRYIIAVIFVTTGCLMWYFSSRAYFFRILGNFLICIPVFILEPTQLTEPIHFIQPKWNAKKIFTALPILLGIILFVILMNELPDHGDSLFGKWYFVATIWLILLSVLSRRWYVEKEEIAEWKETYADSEQNKVMGSTIG